MELLATKRTPYVLIDGTSGRFEMSGESMPEDLRQFFDPVLAELEAELMRCKQLSARFQLVYFNSASARAIFDLIMRFDKMATGGASVQIRWVAEEDDDTMREYGEDFSIHIKTADFKVVTSAEV